MNFEMIREGFEKISDYLGECSQCGESHLFALMDDLGAYEKLVLTMKERAYCWPLQMEEFGVRMQPGGTRWGRFVLVHESDRRLGMLVFNMLFDKAYNGILYEYTDEDRCGRCYVKSGFNNEWQEQKTTEVFSLLLSEAQQILHIDAEMYAMGDVLPGLSELMQAGSTDVSYLLNEQ